MHARPIRSSLGPDPNGSAPVCTGPKLAEDETSVYQNVLLGFVATASSIIKL